MIRLLLLVVLFFPLVRADEPSSLPGVGGWAIPEQLDELGARWFHQWNLCSESGGWYWAPDRCVSVVKNPWQYGEQQIRDDIRGCYGGWFMFGDEWNVQGWTVTEQAEALHWFHEIAHEAPGGNPACPIAFGGWMVGAGQDWLDVGQEYKQLYGQRLPVDALVVDTYLWPGQDWHAEASRAVQGIRAAYPGLEVWAREMGCLTGHNCALAAMEKHEPVAALFDRWAWYTIEGYEPSDLYCGGELTDLGKLYREAHGW